MTDMPEFAFNLGEVLDQDTLSRLRGATIWSEGGAGNIYLNKNADLYECTINGALILDKEGKQLPPEDETYQTIVNNSKRQAGTDDTILKELFE